MNYFIDTEFIETADYFKLISIGITREDGYSFYAESTDFDERHLTTWLKEHVIPHLEFWHKAGASRRLMPNETKQVAQQDGTVATICYGTEHFIANAVLDFIHPEDDKHPVFYGYYANYDWVLFMRLFGCMMDKPDHFPMYCLDIKQMMDQRGLTKEWKRQNCPDPDGEHHAGIDAAWNKKLYETVMIQGHRTEEMAMRGALNEMVKAQQRMLEKWADGDDNVKADLWKKLHEVGNMAQEMIRYNR